MGLLDIFKNRRRRAVIPAASTGSPSRIAGTLPPHILTGEGSLAGIREIREGDKQFANVVEYQGLCDHVRDMMQSSKFAEAQAPAEEVVRLGRQLFGSEHTETAIGLRNLAWIYDELGDRRAAPLYEEAVAICEVKLGMQHERTIRYREELGLLHRKGAKESADRTIATATSVSARKGVSPVPAISEFAQNAHKALCGFLGRDLHTVGWHDSSEAGMRAALFVERGTSRVYGVTPRGDHWDAWLLVRTGENISEADDISWLIDGGTLIEWTSEEDETCQRILNVLKVVLPKDVSSADLRFSHMSTEPDKTAIGQDEAILRKTFVGRAGWITWHSRRVPGGTDIVIEVRNKGEYLRLFHHPDTGEAEPRDNPPALPF